MASTLSEGWLSAVIAAGLVLLAMLYSYFTKKIDLAGGITGVVFAALLYAGSGWLGLALLFTFFFAGSYVSRLGIDQKQMADIAQEDGGRRGIDHALANGGFPVICHIGLLFYPEPKIFFLVAAATGFAVACSDTFSSELGNVYGRRFFNIISQNPDLRGRDGTVSREGFAYGVLGSTLIAIVFAFFYPSAIAFVLILAGGFAGNVFDSILGATLQRKGALNNHWVNFISIATAGTASGLAALVLGW
jgi:uncharacterized protein (TIGR00297 family)